MAKKQQSNLQDEPTQTDLDYGAIPQELAGQLEEVDPLQNIVTFVPGKPGWTVGMKKSGVLVGTKRVFSEKFTAGKKDENGKKYRDLHILRHPQHGLFGIWSVGTLGYALEKPEMIGRFIVIEYTGLGEALKVGQSAPHTFKFLNEKNKVLDVATMGDEGLANRGAREANLGQMNA